MTALRAPKPRPMVAMIYQGVPTVIDRITRDAVSWLNATQPIHHRISVKVVPNACIAAGDRDAFGVFIWPRQPTNLLHIYLAGCIADTLGMAGIPRRDVPIYYLDTLFHEFVHYEQWRDGRQATERGVAVRSRNLHDQFRAARHRKPLLAPKGRTLFADGKVRL